VRLFHANDKKLLKKVISQNIFIQNSYKIFAGCDSQVAICCTPKKVLTNLLATLRFFAICFLPKFDEIDAWVEMFGSVKTH
jgi:hypothetical protein